MFYQCYMNAPDVKARESHPSSEGASGPPFTATRHKSVSLSPRTLVSITTLFKRKNKDVKLYITCNKVSRDAPGAGSRGPRVSTNSRNVVGWTGTAAVCRVFFYSIRLFSIVSYHFRGHWAALFLIGPISLKIYFVRIFRSPLPQTIGGHFKGFMRC